LSESEHRTNPQVQRTHRLMLDAAGALLTANGPDAVTHLRVAEAAGVSRATVYRHWPERADILLDLLRRSADGHPSPPPPDLPIIDRVSALLRAFVDTLNGDGGQILAAMVGLAEWDGEVFTALERMTDQGPETLRVLLADGATRGEIDPEVDLGLLSDRLIGAVYLRRLLYHDEITGTYVDALVRSALDPHLLTHRA